MYNCRCTLIGNVKDAPKTPNPLHRAIDPEAGRSVLISDMSYAQWESWKSSENRYMWDTYQKMGKNASSDKKQYDKYRQILGKKMPNTLQGFQVMKYRQLDKWKELKKLALKKKGKRKKKDGH